MDTGRAPLAGALAACKELVRASTRAALAAAKAVGAGFGDGDDSCDGDKIVAAVDGELIPKVPLSGAVDLTDDPTGAPPTRAPPSTLLDVDGGGGSADAATALARAGLLPLEAARLAPEDGGGGNAAVPAAAGSFSALSHAVSRTASRAPASARAESV